MPVFPSNEHQYNTCCRTLWQTVHQNSKRNGPTIRKNYQTTTQLKGKGRKVPGHTTPSNQQHCMMMKGPAKDVMGGDDEDWWPAHAVLTTHGYSLWWKGKEWRPKRQANLTKVDTTDSVIKDQDQGMWNVWTEERRSSRPQHGAPTSLTTGQIP